MDKMKGGDYFDSPVQETNIQEVINTYRTFGDFQFENREPPNKKQRIDFP